MAAMRGLLEIAVSEATKEHLLRTDQVCEWISDGETHLKVLRDCFHWYQTQSFQTANKGIATTLPPQARAWGSTLRDLLRQIDDRIAEMFKIGFHISERILLNSSACLSYHQNWTSWFEQPKRTKATNHFKMHPLYNPRVSKLSATCHNRIQSPFTKWAQSKVVLSLMLAKTHLTSGKG